LGRTPSELKRQINHAELCEIYAFKQLQLDSSGSKKNTPITLNEPDLAEYMSAWGATKA